MSEPRNDVTLTSRAEVVADELVIRTTVHNGSRGDVYLLDRPPAEASGPAAAGLYVCWKGRATALVLQGIAPLPPDRDVRVRAIPLGTRVPPGEGAERELRLPIPLAEQGPYDPPLPAESEEAGAVETVTRVLLRVHFLRDSTDGFVAEPGPFPETFRVRARHTAGQAESLESELEVPALKLRRRTDGFGRI